LTGSRLAKGYPVGLYMNDVLGQPTKLWNRKISLKALCSLSPAIARALAAHNSKNKSKSKTIITDILLPGALVEAYQKLFEWFERVLTTQALVPLARLESFAIYKYYHILIISTFLNIDYVTNDLSRRYQRMFTVTPSRYFSIDLDNICMAYKDMTTGQALRKDIVGAVAFAYSNSLLKRYQYKKIDGLREELPGFGLDMDARLACLGPRRNIVLACEVVRLQH